LFGFVTLFLLLPNLLLILFVFLAKAKNDSDSADDDDNGNEEKNEFQTYSTTIFYVNDFQQKQADF
jgi:hypothetical protein